MLFSAGVGFVFFAPAIQGGGATPVASGERQVLVTTVSAAFIGLAVELFLRFREKDRSHGLRFGTRDLLVAISVVAIALGIIVFLRRP
jgi:hypothetical protein